ncbi:MAG: 16S rRNA processing protein RimM [Flavobacteriales bacterium]|nr:16S rRNA processing protein RimM [Flavobacteriales bacterium]MBP9080218.1 16S rRNA processing protein RimM [Flavobacteriales bacterium]
MNYGNLRPLGSLGKPWGHRGEVALRLEGASFGELQDLGVLFVELDGSRVPFFVAHFREHPRIGAVVKFEDIDDPQGAAFLVNAPVFAPPGHEPQAVEEEEEDEESLDPDELLGMHVLDEEHGALGEVVGTDGTEDNPVMVVRNGDQEILIPMVQEMIIGIDLNTGHLVVRTPPGLVALYRGH